MVKLVSPDLFLDIPRADMAEVVDFCKKQKVIGVDIETGRKFEKGVYREDAYFPGLDPRLSRIVMIQVGTEELQYIIDARSVDFSGLKDILEDKSILKVGHNLQFEGQHFLHAGISLKGVWDTMIVEKVLYNGAKFSYSLEALMGRYFGIKSAGAIDLFEDDDDDFDIYESLALGPLVEEKLYVDKSIRTRFVNIGDRSFTEAEILYGADDIIYPLRIRKIQMQGREIDGEDYYPELGIQLENDYTQCIAKMSYTGMPFDARRWKEAYEKNFPIYVSRIEFLNKFVISEFPTFAGTIDLFTTEPSCSIDWASSKQVIHFFLSAYKWCPKEVSKQTGKLDYTVGAKAMYQALHNEYKEAFMKDISPEEIKSKDDFILAYLLMKKSQMLTTTFGLDWLRFVHPISGRIHAGYQQYMHSGRLSSQNPNQQNLPKPSLYRRCFCSANDIVTADYASQESRVLADVSNNKPMLEFFNNGHPLFGTDSHSYAATLTFRIVYDDPNWICDKNVHKKERTAAKTIAFGSSYGVGAKSLAGQLGIPEEDAQKFLDGYFEGWKGLAEEFEVTKKLGVERGWIELDSYTGKRYFYPDFSEMVEAKKKALSYFPEEYRSWDRIKRDEFKQSLKEIPEYRALWKTYGILKGKLERRSLNYRIQGAAATIMKIAHLLINKYLEQYPGSAVVGVVHDELIIEVVGPHAEKIKTGALSLMEKAGSFVCHKVKIPAEADIAKEWKK